jgi:negative regulator of replication initiation
MGFVIASSHSQTHRRCGAEATEEKSFFLFPQCTFFMATRVSRSKVKAGKQLVLSLKVKKNQRAKRRFIAYAWTLHKLPKQTSLSCGKKERNEKP